MSYKYILGYNFAFLILSPFIVVMVLLFLAVLWKRILVIIDNRTIVPCNMYESPLNYGCWLKINLWKESNNSNFIVSDMALFTHIASGYVWAWYITNSTLYYRLSMRDYTGIDESINRRKLIFIGDSITRNLYFAFCRHLGIMDLDFFNIPELKHTDFYKLVDQIELEFKWSPLAKDCLANIIEIRKLLFNQKISRLSLIVIGSGVWDQLHLFSTKEDRVFLRLTLKELAKEIKIVKKLGVLVAWITPTTIDNPALTTDRKKDHMTEESIAKMRIEYAEAGILVSSSFVLNGPGFTKDLINECIDGVHYPPEVYDVGAQVLVNILDFKYNRQN